MKNTRLLSIVSAGLIAGLLWTGTAAIAETRWERHHPRRDQVNDRLERQHARIHAGLRNGQLTPQEARQLRQEDRQIRQQERSFASQNNGHITRAEQKQLNQEENAVSRQVYQERHDGQ